tara:strand:- start:3100 stop:3300 length:201 start_codon:yes stop_codon:yes gene_type:complete
MKIGDLVKHPPTGAIGLVTQVFNAAAFGNGRAEVVLIVLGEHDVDQKVGDSEYIKTKYWKVINESR